MVLASYVQERTVFSHPFHCSQPHLFVVQEKGRAHVHVQMWGGVGLHAGGGAGCKEEGGARAAERWGVGLGVQ